MTMSTVNLLDKVEKIEAFFAGATTHGEKEAAGAAVDRTGPEHSVRTSDFFEVPVY